MDQPPATAAMQSKAEVRPKADDALFETIRDRFKQAVDAENDNRKSWIEDVTFSCATDQWDATVKTMRGAWRPALTFNHLNAVVKQVVNDYRQNKLTIKVLPASGDASEDIADILGGLIRNIESQSNSDSAYTTALDCAVRGGFGYFRIIAKYASDDAFDQDLCIEPIHNPLTVYFDPSARLSTREDAKWAFITEILPKEEFEALYPDAEAIDFEGTDNRDWISGDTVRVAEYFEKVNYEARLVAFSNGMVIEVHDDSEIEAMAQMGIQPVKERISQRTKIVWRKVTATEELDYREYPIKYIPIIPVFGEEVNLEGKIILRSAIAYAKDPQRMLNYQKSVAIEVAALAPKAPFVGTARQFEGLEDQWDNANVTPQSKLIYNFDPQAPGAPQRMQPSMPPVAELALSTDASDEIKATTGMFNASLGDRSNEVSGIAIEGRQQEGNTATYNFVDNLKKAIEHCGKILLNWIPLVYDTERVVRVLDMEGNPTTETVNQQQYDPMTGVTQILNSITVGKYDVVMTTGPSFASRRREGVAGMLKIAQIDPTFMPKAGDLFIKNMDFPGAPEIAERYKRAMPPQLTVDPDSPEGKQMQAQAAQQQANQQQIAQQVIQGKIQTAQAKQQSELVKSQASMAKANAEMVKASSDVIQAKLGVLKSATDAKADHANRVWDVATHATPHHIYPFGEPHGHPQSPAA